MALRIARTLGVRMAALAFARTSGVRVSTAYSMRSLRLPWLIAGTLSACRHFETIG